MIPGSEGSITGRTGLPQEDGEGENEWILSALNVDLAGPSSNTVVTPGPSTTWGGRKN